MIAVGFLGKAFVRWERDGRRVHIFNPSAFSLGLFSVVLIATGATPLTWGEDIATTLTLAPRIYLFLFLAGLVVMYRFAITLVAGSAAVVLFGLSAIYSAATGVPYFLDSEIPTAVFLGLHLLVTDPSTSPRTPLGKTVFGVLYGGGVFVLYSLLGAFGAPTFYDKLLSVPLLNLSVRWIDRLAGALEAGVLGRVAERMARPNANLAQMAVWIVFFAAMTLIGATDGRHRGDTVPFWQQACTEGRAQACERLLQIEASYCADASAWACNELGRHYTDGEIVAADAALGLDYYSPSLRAPLPAGLPQPAGAGQRLPGAAEDARPAAAAARGRKQPDGDVRGRSAGAGVRARLDVRLRRGEAVDPCRPNSRTHRAHERPGPCHRRRP